MGKISTLITLAIASLLITGCSSPSLDTEVPDATPSPTVEAPKLATFSITCSSEDFSSRKSYDKYSEAWADSATYPNCEATLESGSVYTGVELAAFEASKYKKILSLDTLYSLCAETTELYFLTSQGLSDSQADELSGMLTLCPDHPSYDVLLAKLTGYRDWVAGGSIKTGFGPGLYLVGSEIQPGTYKTTQSVESCYWERQDASGRTIENEYILAAPSATVTILGSDISFLTEGCGRFELVQ